MRRRRMRPWPSKNAQISALLQPCELLPFQSVLLTAWPKLNTGPWSNQTKALAELRRKCGKDLANFECSKFEGFANSRASQVIISLRALREVAKYRRCLYIKAIIA